MKKIIRIITIVSCSSIIGFTTSSCGSSCEGHEKFIKSEFESRGKNFTIDYLTVEYLGNCKYRVKEGYTIPASSVASGGYQTLDHIYTWKDGDIVF